MEYKYLYKLWLILVIFILLFVYLFFTYNFESFRSLNKNNLNIDTKITICLKTIYRSKLLNEHLKNIRKYLPNTKIIVGDDSDDSFKQKNKKVIEKFNNVEYLPLPFDIGLSSGRNKLVEKVDTDYILMVDDSKGIDDAEGLKNVINFLEENKEYDLICGNCHERGNYHGKYTHLFTSILINNSKSNILKDKKALKTAISNNEDILVNAKFVNNNNLSKINNNNNLTLYKVDLAGNYFVARTSLLKSHPWCNKLKLSEHEDFFIKLFADNIGIAYCENLKIKQFDEKFRKYEKSNLRGREMDFKNKHNIKFVIN